MRSCIYCGRELEKGEKCNCPTAAAKRQTNESTGSSDNTSGSYNSYYNAQNNSSYQTGYTKKDNPFKRSWEKNKARAHAWRNGNEAMNKGFWKNLWRFFIRFIMSPVETIANPGYISKATAIVTSGIEGAIIGLCMYFISTGIVRSPFGIAFSLLSFNPVKTYSNLMYIGLNILSGALRGILIFFIYAGIFHFINRFILRQNTRFWEFAPRLSFTAIPFATLCLFGTLFGMISSTTLAILVIVGAVSMMFLTYEALKTEWVAFSNSKVLYLTMLGIFLFTAVICYIIRLS